VLRKSRCKVKGERGKRKEERGKRKEEERGGCVLAAFFMAVTPLVSAARKIGYAT
jgi:hypothetical protein